MGRIAEVFRLLFIVIYPDIRIYVNYTLSTSASCTIASCPLNILDILYIFIHCIYDICWYPHVYIYIGIHRNRQNMLFFLRDVLKPFTLYRSINKYIYICMYLIHGLHGLAHNTLIILDSKQYEIFQDCI